MMPIASIAQCSMTLSASNILKIDAKAVKISAK